jgi:hypothetical protein
MLRVVEETFSVEVTMAQRDAIEFMAKEEVPRWHSSFETLGSCWYCHARIDPDNPDQGHTDDCIYPAICRLAVEFDSE